VNHLLQLLRSFKLGTSGKWSLVAALVGLIVGVACIAFDRLTQLVHHWTLWQFAGLPQAEAVGEYSHFEQTGTGFEPWLIVVVITIGGLVSGCLVYWLAPEAEGAGMDAAVDAFHNRKGVINWRVPLVKTIASAVTLGTGGSGGREGPIAQIGAGIGSWIAGGLGLSSRDRRILLAVGMGAGVGAMFRAPLAGAIFAAEILYSEADMEADVIVPAAIASIVAYSVYTQSLHSDVRFAPIFGGELGHQLNSPMELIPYTLLAILLLLIAAAYVRFFHATQASFSRLRIPPHFRPAIGALMAGLIGVSLYHLCGNDREMLGVLGTGYGTLQRALVGDNGLTIGILGGVAAVKILTTSLSIGSGGSGGIFGPSMVIGGCAGAAFGQAAHQLFPSLVPYPEAYAVVGMAGFFSGVARAPISTIIMIRELTGDFGLIVPTMLVATLTFILSGHWKLYRKQVPSRMESPAHRGDFLVDVLEGLRVEDVYQKDRQFMTIHEGTSLDEIVHRLAETTQHYFPVVDEDGEMVGIFSDDDVRSYLYDETLWRLANARDVMTSEIVKVSPEDDLNTALQRFTALNLDELPVVNDHEQGRILGFLRRKETIAAYNRRILEHRRELDQE
jgi:CIC family chloride channel protein